MKRFTAEAHDAASSLRVVVSVEFSPEVWLQQGSIDGALTADGDSRLIGQRLGSEMPLLLDQALERARSSLYHESAEVLAGLVSS